MKMSSPVTWHGGKARLAERIVAHFPWHRTYCEPFGGGAAVLLAKPPSPVEIYNDLDRTLSNLFAVLRDPFLSRELVLLLERTPYARSEFEQSKIPCSNPVESARRLIIRQRQSFGGRGEHWSFSIKDTHAGISSAIRRWQRGIELLPSIHQRLRSVQIECDDWRVILDRYDSDNTLFFLDPPYHPSTRVDGGYHHELSAEDHRELIRHILPLRGMVLLSGYANETYELLERRGWVRMDYDVPAYSSQNRTRRVESLWLSPLVVRHNGCLQSSGSPTDKMRQGAHHVHSLRVTRTTKKVVRVLEMLRGAGEKPTMAAVARLAKVSREHLGRRYRHLFM